MCGAQHSCLFILPYSQTKNIQGAALMLCLRPATPLTAPIENPLPLSLQTVYNRRMDIIYQLPGVEYAWDAETARSHLADRVCMGRRR